MYLPCYKSITLTLSTWVALRIKVLILDGPCYLGLVIFVSVLDNRNILRCLFYISPSHGNFSCKSFPKDLVSKSGEEVKGMEADQGVCSQVTVRWNIGIRRNTGIRDDLKCCYLSESFCTKFSEKECRTGSYSYPIGS